MTTATPHTTDRRGMTSSCPTNPNEPAGFAGSPIWSPDLFTTAGMDAAQRRVFNALWPDHVGRARAISRDDLAEATQLADREMRDVLASLTAAHNVPIGSSLSAPAGYFIIATRGEAAEQYRIHRSYGIASLKRAAGIRRIVDRETLRRIQTELPLPPERLN